MYGSDGIKTTMMITLIIQTITKLYTASFLAPSISFLPTQCEITEDRAIMKKKPATLEMNSKGLATVIPDSAASLLGSAYVTKKVVKKE